MSKLVTIVLGTACLVAVTAPATFLLINQDNGEEFKKPNWNILIPSWNYSSEIKNKYSNIECLKDDFQEINWGDIKTKMNMPTPKPTFQNDLNTKGCLIVEYYKQTFGSGKWVGEFKLIWSLKDNQNGLITVFNAKTESQELVIDSSLYLMKKQSSNWKIEYAEEGEYQIPLNPDSWSDDLPKPGSSIKEYEEKDGYWDFNPDLNNVCEEENCGKVYSKPKQVSSIWELKIGGSEHVKNWCKNLDKWLEASFDNASGVMQMIENIRGTWTKKS